MPARLLGDIMSQSYMLAAVSALEKVTDFHGKDILEIGGTLNFTAPKAMRERGAKRVVVTNIGHGIRSAEKQGTSEPRIEARYADALALVPQFEENSFDIVFATAVMEHIPNTPLLLENIQKVLRPGGVAFLSGGPLWSSARGHHVWVNTEKGPVRFSQAGCPIPNWAHLAFSPDEMTDHLAQTTDFSDVDVRKITHWIYNSPNINRLTELDIRTAMQNSGLEVISQKRGRQNAKGELFERAAAKVGREVDIQVSNIHTILRKPKRLDWLTPWRRKNRRAA